MGRQIVTANDLLIKQARGNEQAAGVQPINMSKDGYFNRLLKYIPTEIVGLYLTLNNIINIQEKNTQAWMSWFIFAICLIFIPLYLNRVLKVKKKIQILISSISFVVWAYALGGPFATCGLFNNLFAALLLPIYTVLISIIKPEQ